ncbi:T9SS type A sorting domain-containing protein [Candidatus Latescibacterota bacterium]
MVVAFSKFKGEAPGNSLAPEWAEKLFDGEKGSIPYYFNEISFGQIKVTGEYLPKRYELPRDSTYYVNNLADYTYDFLRSIDLDRSVNFADFDNDGPDNIPGSDDDDGFVDYIVLMPMSRPYNFIQRGATGIARLFTTGTFYTNDRNFQNNTIRIPYNSGCISVGAYYEQAMGTLCHEYLHTFGLPDLYDIRYTDDETDSAGIGFWGIMGQGILGWNFKGGPVGPNAYTRMRLGIIGINNSTLEDIFGVHKDIRISDVGQVTGKVYRIWISNSEYFLIEHRRNDSTHSDRNTPQNGLLIWHIFSSVNGNYNEEIKLCDLECADGRFLDAGYPLGKRRNTFEGRDNLDFWSHKDWYATTYGGNLGDATDVYDGKNFTSFGSRTNPNSNSYINDRTTGVEISDIRVDGKDMLFDVSTPPFTDWSKEKYPLIGTAYLRHNNIFDSDDNSAKKGNVIYVINYGENINADELITVFPDSFTVDNIDSLNYLEVQNIIENRIISDNVRNYNSRIVRKNITYNEYSDELTDIGYNPGELGAGRIPEWIQKISVIFSDAPKQDAIVLSQNYPNPFNAQTSIKFSLSAAGPVTLEVYNLLGQKVLTVDRGFVETGTHTILLNPEHLSSGVYLYRLIGETFSETKKFLLIR